MSKKPDVIQFNVTLTDYEWDLFSRRSDLVGLRRGALMNLLMRGFLAGHITINTNVIDHNTEMEISLE